MVGKAHDQLRLDLRRHVDGVLPAGQLPHRPLTMLREAWHLMDRMLTGDRTPFEGEFFEATAELYFQFEVPRRVPLFIGTWGPQTARLAGKFAPGIKIDCTAGPQHIARLRSEFLAGRAAAGRSGDEAEIIAGPLTSIHEDRAVADDHIRGFLALLQPFLAPMTRAAGIAEEEINASYDAFNRGDVREAKALVTDKAIEAFTLTGTPGDVIERVEGMVAAGADHVAFGPPIGPDPMGALALLGTKVLPHFGAGRP
ncbi:LLM class flavin-dependent oxidoreductase [Amycolatopsis sp. M39]